MYHDLFAKREFDLCLLYTSHSYYICLNFKFTRLPGFIATLMKDQQIYKSYFDNANCV